MPFSLIRRTLTAVEAFGLSIKNNSFQFPDESFLAMTYPSDDVSQFVALAISSWMVASKPLNMVLVLSM